MILSKLRVRLWQHKNLCSVNSSFCVQRKNNPLYYSYGFGSPLSFSGDVGKMRKYVPPRTYKQGDMPNIIRMKILLSN